MLRTIIMLAAGLLLVAGATTATAVTPQTEAADAAADYIIGLQNADGGFPGFGDESAPGVTLDAVFALVAAGVDPATVETDGNSPMDYLAAQAADFATDPGSATKLAYGVIAAGRDPTDFAGLDLVAVLEDNYDGATGKYGIDLFDHAFYLFTLAALGEPVPPLAVEYLRSTQLDDGGWEFGPDFESDSNTTAMVVQALIAAGVATDDATVVAALDYLRSTQVASGAFAFLADSDPDAQSTAMVIQALVAAGEDLDGWAVDGVTPMEALLTFQNPETGAFQFAGEDSPFATYQVVPGLMLAPFPGLKPLLLPGDPTPTMEPIEDEIATVTPGTPEQLPDTGGGPDASGAPWWLVAALTAGAAAAGTTAVAIRRRS